MALALGAALVLLTASGCGGAPADQAREVVPLAPLSTTGQVAEIQIPHLHGMGYLADGLRLVLAVHDGVRVYAAGRWSDPDIPRNDYMGYSVTDDGFYASGHPGPGVALPNPLGLVKSTDEGRSLSFLGLTGEGDLHAMAVGYRSHVVYALNQSAGTTLGAGLFSSRDDGVIWRQGSFRGVAGDLIQMAVHPTDTGTVVLATSVGLFRSTDAGDNFQAVISGRPVSAVTYAASTGDLYFGLRSLARLQDDAPQPVAVEGPVLSAEDAISYIAVSPIDPTRMAIATFERSVYETSDGGSSWRQIADRGVAPTPPP